MVPSEVGNCLLAWGGGGTGTEVFAADKLGDGVDVTFHPLDVSHERVVDDVGWLKVGNILFQIIDDGFAKIQINALSGQSHKKRLPVLENHGPIPELKMKKMSFHIDHHRLELVIVERIVV